MEQEYTPEDIDRLVKDFEDLIRRIAKDASVVRILAENEPLGDLVVYSLLDDTPVKSSLWAYLKMISEWLKKTEDLYQQQFPEGFPQKDGRYDLTERPPNFKSRFDIFKEQAEAWESSSLWSAEVVLGDPLTIFKRMRKRPGER
jgi:hypothetical protein